AAMAVDLARAKERVGLALPGKLHLACLLDPRLDRARRLAGRRRDQLAFPRRRHFELDIDPVGERARNAAAVARDALGGAAAAAGAIAAVAAGTGIHRRDKLEAGGEQCLVGRTRDRDAARLERLAQRLEYVAVEFRQLIEEQDAVVRERDLARARERTAAHQCRARSAVVGRAERPLAPARRFETAGGDGMN